jgi:hypothetical protein
MSDEQNSTMKASAHAAEASSLHMAYVLGNVIGHVMNGLPPEQRQAVFFRLATTAYASVDRVQGPVSEETKREVRARTKAHVDISLKMVAMRFRLQLLDLEDNKLRTQ